MVSQLQPAAIAILPLEFDANKNFRLQISLIECSIVHLLFLLFNLTTLPSSISII